MTKKTSEALYYFENPNQVCPIAMFEGP